MKKINLIERLWTDSHEKQKPQRFVRYAAMLIMLLTLGVGQMWATKCIYIDFGDYDWPKDGACLKVWDGSSNVSITQVSGKLYKADIADAVTTSTTLYFKRLQSDCGNDADGKRWNEANCKYSSTYNCYKLTGWGSISASYNVSTVTKTNYIYFDNSTTNWSNSYKYFVIGHDRPSAYSKVYSMSALSHTKLWYVAQSSDSWTDLTYYAICSPTSSWSGTSWGSSNISNANKYAAPYKDKYDMNNGSSYLFTPASSSNNCALTIDYKDGYSALNYSQTVKKYTSTDGGSTYSAASINSGTVTITPYKLTNNGTVSNSSNTGTLDEASETSVSKDAVYTGEVTVTASANSGYTFVGWFTAASGGSAVSTDESYTYNAPKSTKTIYARFKENRYQIKALTPSPSAGGTSNSPASWTYAGQISGGSISVSTSTGYNFTGWTISHGSGTFANSSATSTTFYPTADSELRPNFTAKTINLTLDGNGGSDGSATVKYDASSLTGISHASWAGHSLTGYWTAESGGDKVLDADGTLNNVSGWVTGGYWKKATDGTLYAQWTEDVTYYDVTYAVHESGHGSLSAANTSTSAAISSGSSVVNGTGVTFTASPSTGYTVDGWFSNSACTSPIAGAGSGNTYSTTITAATTVYVKFKEQTWSVAFAAGTGGTVTTPNSTPRTVGQVTGISIAATPATGYTFNTWTITSGSGSFTSAATTNSNTFKPTAASTVTASFNETMRTVAIVGGTTASTTAGVVTTGSATAAAPAAGKKFTGWSLGAGVTLSGGSLTDRTINFTATANATVTANYADRAQVKMYFAKPTISGWTNAYAYVWKSSDASKKNKTYPGVQLASTETINHVVYYTYQYYTEPDGIGGAADGSSEWNSVVFNNGLSGDNEKKTGDLTVSNGHYYVRSSSGTGKTAALTSAWCIKGAWNSWSEDADQITHTAAATGSKSITLTTGNKEFKIYNIVNETWWRFSGNVSATKAATAMDNSSGNMTITPSVAGPYTFALASLTGTPTLAITYPTTYTVTFNAETFVNGDASHSTSTTGGTLSAVDGNSAALSSGGLVISGGTAVITASKKTGYSFIGFYTTAACTTPISGAGVSISDNVLTLSSISGNKTVYAKFSENMTTVNLVASPMGKGTFTSGDDAVTSVSAGVTTKPAVTAVPASGYRVNTSATVWTKNNDNITLSSATANPITVTGCGTGSTSSNLTATFTPIVYTITLNDNEGSGGVGSATVTFDHDNFAFASSFVAPTRTGYIFQGYYTASSMDVGDQLIDKDGNWHSDTEPYVYIDGGGNWIYPNNMTLYAGWTPITFTIHYDANGGSGSMDDQVAKYEVESSLDGQNSFISTNGFTAPTGYSIYHPAHPWNTSADGTGTDIDAATYQSTLTSTNGATVNLYAQWSGRFALKANYDGGVDGYFRVHYNTAIIEALTTLYPTRLGYLCDGYYTAASDGTKVLNGNGTVVDGNVSGYVTGGKWTYKGTQDFYAHWNQIKYNLAFDGNDCAAYVGEATGSKASMANVEYETDVDITAGTLAREGYTFAGWSKTACATSPTYVGSTTRHISSTDGDNVTLYAVWTPKTYTISFNALGGDCYTPSKTVAMGANYGSLPTAWGNSGYEFVGWYTRPEGGTLVTEETQMVTASDHTLYAHYEKKERVYFKNTLGWESVYVTWDATWNYNSEDKGAGARGKTQELMSHIYGTDIWYKDVPAAILSSWKGNIAFTNIAMPNYDWFDDGQAVYRRDFDSDATMFVPTPKDPHKYTKNKHDSKPGTEYYSTDMVVDKSGDDVTNYRYKNGYWVRYDELQSGYTVKGSWAWDDDHYVERHSLDDSTYVFTIRNLSANSNYWFNLYKHCTTDNDYSSVFKPNADMTSASSDVVFSAQYAGGGDKKMTTTVAGDYTFKFVFSRLGEIRLTIEYPLAVNDYRVVYGWNDGSAQTFSSEYIKAKADAVDTISMFIHSGDNATARSLYIQKCTGITDGVPTWNTTYSAITLPSETASGKTSGVYNFRIAQNGSAAATGESIGKYDGNYYIRTDSAAGGWDFYKEYPASQMTFSEYSLSQTLSAPYSHYYCQYVGNSSTDISYTIATDYSPAICPIQEGDATIGVGNKTLPSGKPASVRFTWNEETNGTFRSYLKSAQGDGNKRFLVLHGSDNKVLDADGNEIAAAGAGAEDMHANELLFSDTENWVYELAFKAKPGAKVSIIARYNDVDRYLVGKADAWETIISGGADTKYDIAAVYDFKTNRLITTWIPSGTISDQIEEVDVLIERHNQDGATTITFGRAAMEEEAGSISAKRVIGALRFEYNELVGRVASWTPDTRAKMMFFVSFPFDVNVSDIFGLNTNYGEAFIVQGYNGALRAEKGFFKGDGTDTFWEMMPVDSVMHAGVGYVVTLDNDYFNGDVGHIWDNKKAGDHVYMYFPSANDPEHPVIINSDDKTINVPKHLCTINRTFNSGKLNHKYTDSNWNLMGVPIFQNHTGDDGIAGTPGAIFTATKEPEDTTSYANPENPAFGYFYVWNTDKTYTIQSAVDFVFKPMHSYMVQYAGDVKFTCAEPVVPSLAPRRTAMKENYNIELQVLNNGGDMLNHTYVELRENACDTFALNEDTYMMSSNKAVSVYTFAGTYDVAANVLSIGSHVVPVGVIVKQAGTYTFTMPSNFSGTVTLVDTYAQTRTNLALEDYEVYLENGTDEERFELEININQVPTTIDGVSDGQGTLKDGKAHKFIMNDMMYIIKDGVLYDAQGKRVK